MAKKKSEKKKTDKPTGVSITRKDYKFTTSWHRGESYESQEFHYKVNDGKWHEKKISKSDSKESFELTESKWNPKASKTVSKVIVKVTGKAKKETEVSVSKTMKIRKPKKPKISVTSIGDNWVTFRIEKPNEQEKRPITRIDYEYVVVPKYNGSNSSKGYWSKKNHKKYSYTSSNFDTSAKNVTVKINGDIYNTYEKDKTGKTVKKDHTQTVIIRARCRGIGGDSKNVYNKHIFSDPWNPTNPTINEFSTDKKRNITKVMVSWTANPGKRHPIDSTTVQYAIGTPSVSREYVLQSSIRGEVENIQRAEYNLFNVYIPKNSFPSKIVVLYDSDEEDDEVPSDKIEYWVAGEDIFGTKLKIHVTDSSYYAEEAIVYWISSDAKYATDEDSIYIRDYYDEDNYRYVTATYAQLCDFDTEYEFYKQQLVFEPPEGVSPTDGLVQKDTGGIDKAVLEIDTILGYDQCFWIRIRTIHDNRPSYSNWVLAPQKGTLSPPTINSISTPDTSTYKMTVTATNNSAVPYSFIALIYQDADSSEYSGKVIGIIPAGETSASFQCPIWDGHEPFTFGAYAVCGGINYKNCTYITDAGTPDPITIYSLYEDMTSEAIFNAGHIPVAPDKVTADKVEGKKGTVQVTWESSWKDATGAEVSWADHDDAWYSTSGPSSYTVESIKQPKLNVSDLATGMKWYFCVRLYRTMADGSTIYGPPSEIVVEDLSEAPSVPVLTLTPNNVVSYESEIKASWTYVVEDDSQQESATLAEVIEGNINPVILKQFSTETVYRFKPEDIVNDGEIDLDWSVGTEHALVVMVSSTGGKSSPWSEPVTVTVEEPLICTVESTNLDRGTVNEPLDYPILRALPLTVTVGGGDENDVEAVMIKRYDDFPIVRPDNSEYVGYEGEIVCYKEADEDQKVLTEDTSVDPDKVYYTYDLETDSYTAVEPEGNENPSQEGWYENEVNNTITIGLEDLEEYGTQFDDEGLYQIIASIQAKDSNGKDGQLSVIPDEENSKIIPDPLGISEENFEFFGVKWDTQAIIPDEDDANQWITAEILYDDTVTDVDRRWKPGVGVIHIGSSPIQDDTAHLDIYRLSAGKPQLIYQGATFDSDYVDPYPTIGERGGYRVVYITENGDYITDDGPAWVDLDGGLDTKFQLIDFGNKQIEFKFNVSFDNSWDKQFTLTHYLGGKVEGDWIEGVEHTHNIKGVTIDDLDIEEGTLDNIRELAEYAGLCHVRTVEGFNYTANINVSDSSEYNHPYHDHDISFDVTEVANTNLDGMTWEDWNKEEEEEEE